MVITYYFGYDDEYEYYPDYVKVEKLLTKWMSADLNEDAEEISYKLDDEDFFKESFDDYYDALANYFENDAEEEWENSQGSSDGFRSYDDFCRWRNPDL